ncbi:MAG: hypothetical protein ACI3X1_03995 [Eubacteriales bacterium]
MKNRLLKTFTSLVLTALMVISVMPAFAITIGAAEGDTYELVTDVSKLAVGDKVIIVATDSAFAMSTKQNTNNRGQATVTKSEDKKTITNIGTDVQVFKLEVGTSTGTFAFNTNTDLGYIYCASTSTKNYLKSESTKSEKSSWTISIAEDGVATITANTTSTTRKLLSYNSDSSVFACYSSVQKNVSIYKLVETTESGSGSETTTEAPECQHTNTVAIGEAKEATCTVDGNTAGLKCSDCGEILEAQTTIPATGHTYVNGECTVCHEKQPTTLTINRDSFGSASGYAWHGWTATSTTGELIKGYGFIYGTTTSSIQMNSTKDGYHIYNTDALPGKIVSIKLTADKATFRDFYVLTSDTAFDQSTPDTTDATKKNVTTTGATWEFTTSGRYFAIVVTGGAAYLSSIEITYEVCSHANKEPIGAAKDATCTVDGNTAGLKCSDCGEILEEQTTIPATGHKDANNDLICDVCEAELCTEHTYEYKVLIEATCTTTGEKQQVCKMCGHIGETETIPAKGHTEVIDKEAKEPTCTEGGWTKQSHCSVCNEELFTSEDIAATGVHIYVDGTCSMCGKAEPYFFKVGDVVIFTGSKADGTDTQELTGFESGKKFGTATQYTGTPTGKFPITVVEGYQSGTYAFKFGDSYITCNGEKDVNLSTTLDVNSSWNVKLDENDNYEITSCYNISYYLQYNPSSPRFTTYDNGTQQPIKVVKYTGPVIKSFSLSLNEGVTVKVTFDFPEAWLTANEGAKVVFSNGEETVITESGAIVYSVKLTPAQINDDLTVKIQLADGSDYGATNNVSVSAYKTKVEAAYASEKLTYTEAKYKALIALIDAALVYSNAADGAIAEELTNEFTDVDDPTVVHAKEDESGNIVENDKLFTGFAGQLGTYASIFINVNTANVPDGETLVLTVGGTEIINGENIADYITKDKQIVISGLYPANFDDTISIDTTIEGSMAEFTFNSYLKAIYNSSSDKNVKNLAVATYLYGLAAEAYLTAQ